jgi:hypothetical protein
VRATAGRGQRFVDDEVFYVVTLVELLGLAAPVVEAVKLDAQDRQC